MQRLVSAWVYAMLNSQCHFPFSISQVERCIIGSMKYTGFNSDQLHLAVHSLGS